MKKTKKILLLAIAFVIIIAIFGFVNAEGETGNITRVTTTYYFTTIKLTGKFNDEITGETFDFNLQSEELEGNVTDENVLEVINNYKGQFTTFANENGATSILDPEEGIKDYYYDAHDEITQEGVQQGSGDAILVGDVDNLDGAYLNQGNIIINTVLQKHQTYEIKMNAVKGKPVYEFIEGAGQTYTIDQDDTLTFKIDAEYSLFEDGGIVFVDNKEVDPKYYESDKGSTVITFTKEYMGSLEEGEHTLEVAFNDGGTATTSFTVAKVEEEAETVTKTTSPNTGDVVTIWIYLMVVSALGIIATVKSLKK